jgi:hypothetical protein
MHYLCVEKEINMTCSKKFNNPGTATSTEFEDPYYNRYSVKVLDGSIIHENSRHRLAGVIFLP